VIEARTKFRVSGEVDFLCLGPVMARMNMGVQGAGVLCASGKEAILGEDEGADWMDGIYSREASPFIQTIPTSTDSAMQTYSGGNIPLVCATSHCFAFSTDFGLVSHLC
jgi:hypothetical protein